MVKLLAVFLVLLLSAACSNNEQKSGVPVVAVSSFALYDITDHIAQDTVELINILPFGVDPHSFEPTPRLMAKLEKANIVFYSGAGLEPWVHGFHFKSKAINMSHFVHLRKLASDEFELHQHHDEQCAHSTYDPHYWLDFENMKIMTHVVTKELIQLLPKYAGLYKKNEQKYIHMLDKLASSYKQRLSQCSLDTVVISHNALGYLADKYHFHVDSLTGLSPEAQPSAKDITRLMKDIKKKGVRTLFFEHFVNDKVLQSIAKDSGVELEVFQPLGNITADEQKAGLSYEEIMYQNLKKLTKALACN